MVVFSCKLIVQGTLITVAPRLSKQRMMLFFTPQSTSMILTSPPGYTSFSAGCHSNKISRFGSNHPVRPAGRACTTSHLSSVGRDAGVIGPNGVGKSDVDSRCQWRTESRHAGECDQWTRLAAPVDRAARAKSRRGAAGVRLPEAFTAFDTVLMGRTAYVGGWATKAKAIDRLRAGHGGTSTTDLLRAASENSQARTTAHLDRARAGKRIEFCLMRPNRRISISTIKAGI